MGYFVLSQKVIPDLGKFDALIESQIPEFLGLVKDANSVTVLLNCEPNTQLVDAIEAITPPSATLKDVTPRQIRQALILAGVSLQQIEDAINSLPEPTRSLAKVEWEYSNAFERNRPLVAQVGQMLGWTSEQLDQLWVTAANLP